MTVQTKAVSVLAHVKYFVIRYHIIHRYVTVVPDGVSIDKFSASVHVFVNSDGRFVEQD